MEHIIRNLHNNTRGVQDRSIQPDLIPTSIGKQRKRLEKYQRQAKKDKRGRTCEQRQSIFNNDSIS